MIVQSAPNPALWADTLASTARLYNYTEFLIIAPELTPHIFHFSPLLILNADIKKCFWFEERFFIVSPFSSAVNLSVYLIVLHLGALTSLGALK